MSHSTLEYLEHILEETSYLIEKSDDLTYQNFIHDQTLTRAFLRSIEIIGEATKNIPEDFKTKYPATEWRKMAGMRD